MAYNSTDSVYFLNASSDPQLEISGTVAPEDLVTAASEAVDNVTDAYFITPNPQPDLAECTQMILRSDLQVGKRNWFFRTSNRVANSLYAANCRTV